MDKRPERRYESAAAVLEALRAAMTGGEPAAETAAHKQAVAVYVDVRPVGDLEEADEDLLDEVADTLELAEQALVQAGLMIPLHTGSTLLAAGLLPDDPLAAVVARKRVVDQAVDLLKQLGSRGPATIKVNVHVHADAAVVRGTPAAPEITGAIVDVSAWPAGAAWKGITATGPCVADLADSTDATRTVIT
jgi:hypothetical protein